MLYLTRSDVERLLDLDLLLEALEAVMADVSQGLVSMPARVGADVADQQGILAAMPAFLPSPPALATKLVSVFPYNADRPTHQAVIVCFDPRNGTPTALMDGTHITAARTAAGSALATKLLARPSAEVVSIIGSGVQARTHARALARLPQVKRLQVAGRDASKVKSLTADLAVDGLTATSAESIEQAVQSADIVCLTTHSPEPVIRRDWLRPGTHVNSVGYNTAGSGELDAEVLGGAIVAVEWRAAALAAPPAGAVEVRSALVSGILREDDVVEIGELAAGRRRGRTEDSQLTVYKSVGIAAQDAAAATLVLEAALTAGVGSRLDL